MRENPSTKIRPAKRLKHEIEELPPAGRAVPFFEDALARLRLLASRLPKRKEYRKGSRFFASYELDEPGTVSVLYRRLTRREEMAPQEWREVCREYDLISMPSITRYPTGARSGLSTRRSTSRQTILPSHCPLSPADPLASLERQEVRDRLVRTMEELSERERTVITLYFYEGLTLREIGPPAHRGAHIPDNAPDAGKTLRVPGRGGSRPARSLSR